MTEDIESIAKRLVVGRKRDGRSIYDPQARSELVKASQQPGASLARIARLCGINANVLSNWVRQAERGTAGAVVPKADVIDLPAASAFVAVEVGSAAPPAPAPTLELALRARLPNGVTLDMQAPDLDVAGRLIEALGRLRCSASTKP
jgi:transposase